MEINLRSQWARFVSSPIRRQTAGNYILKVANMGLTFLGSVFLARVLGPNDFGMYSFAFALVSILAIVAEVGLPTLVVRETAKGVVQKEFSLVRGLWQWAIRVSGAIALGLVLFGGLFLTLSRIFTGERLETTLWALVLVPLLAVGDVRNAALRGLEKVISGQLPEFVLRPALHLFFLAICLWLIGLQISAPVAMQLYVFAAGIAFLVGLWLWHRGTPRGIGSSRPAYDRRTWTRSTAPLAVLEIMVVANLYIATVMQGFFSIPDAEIGVFRVAQQIAQLASFGLAINLVLGPRFAALYARKDMGGLQHLATYSARIVTALYLGIALFFVFFGKSFLRILFGADYVGAYGLLLIMLLGQLVNAAVGSVGWILNMAHYERAVAGVMAFSVVVSVALNALLIPRVGVVGSAMATAISLVVWNVLLWYLVKKNLGIVSWALYKRERRR